MLRVATATLVLALVTLVAVALWGASAEKGRAEEALATADPHALVRAFEEASPPVVPVDVGALSAGREELLDPREALPTWPAHATDEATPVFKATRACPPHPLGAPLADAALA